MSTSLKKYSSYKDSGIEWLGEIPEHWDLTRSDSFLKTERTTLDVHQFSDQYVCHYSIPSVQETGGFIEEFGSEILSSKQLIKDECVLVSKLNPRKSTICIANNQDRTTICSTEFVILYAVNCTTKFIYYLILNEYFRQRLDSMVESVTNSHKRVKPECIYKFWTLLPPLIEQLQISKFLDQKTQQIDTLVEKKQKQIELLKEYRMGVINDAVTKGLNPDVKMKDSGIEWLGEIPEHWEVKKIKYLLMEGKEGIKIGPFGSSLKLEMMVSEGYKVYGQENVIKDDFKVGSRFITSEKYKEMDVYKLLEGDILVTMMGTTGKCKMFPKDVQNGIIDSHLIKMRTNNTILTQYLVLSINDSDYIKTQIKLVSKGSIMEGLNSSIIKELCVFLPSINEQQQISQYLDQKTQQIDNLIQITEKQIEQLKEYRTSLISEVVTGKVDVREEVV